MIDDYLILLIGDFLFSGQIWKICWRFAAETNTWSAPFPTTASSCFSERNSRLHSTYYHTACTIGSIWGYGCGTDRKKSKRQHQEGVVVRSLMYLSNAHTKVLESVLHRNEDGSIPCSIELGWAGSDLLDDDSCEVSLSLSCECSFSIFKFNK